jgi:outer membrane protein assembly factor BamA
MNMGYAYIKTPFFTEGINASDNRIDHLVSVGFSYEYDTRDLAQFPRSGIFAVTDFSFKGLGIDGINYQVTKFDFKDYRTIFNKLITKWRAATRLTYGSLVPHYDMSILGLNDRVRGHGSERTEGNYYYLFSLEFYYPIIEEWNVKLNFIPFLPEELLSYRIGLYAQIFGDAGATQLKNQKIGLSDFDSGYGAGLTFLFLPYNILRVEFALDEFGNTSWIVNLGISF